MFGGGCDGLVDHLLGEGQVEELAVEVLQQAQPPGVMVRPRQPRLARSSTAHPSDKQERSPGSRPMTFTRRRVSPKVRSMKLEWRILRQCSAGNRKCP
jgi:hypothetical protein